MKEKIVKEKLPSKKASLVVKVLIVTVIVVLVSAGLCYLAVRSGYVKTWNIARQLQKQQQASAGDQKILSDLKKIILLPENITPTMAVITDIEALKKQQPIFFNNSKNGDHLIIYPDMAIVYNAEAKKIMKVGPVQTAVPANSATSTETSAK